MWPQVKSKVREVASLCDGHPLTLCLLRALLNDHNDRLNYYLQLMRQQKYAYF